MLVISGASRYLKLSRRVFRMRASRRPSSREHAAHLEYSTWRRRTVVQQQQEQELQLQQRETPDWEAEDDGELACLPKGGDERRGKVLRRPCACGRAPARRCPERWCTGRRRQHVPPRHGSAGRADQGDGGGRAAGRSRHSQGIGGRGGRSGGAVACTSWCLCAKGAAVS